MSQTVSGATGKPYGVERVCSAWEQARSTFYDRQERAKKSAQGDKPGKRGPTPSVSDEDLLELIRRDLKKSAQGDKPGKRGPTPSVSDEDLLELIRRDLKASPFHGFSLPTFFQG
jgi:hypothetical protein